MGAKIKLTCIECGTSKYEWRSQLFGRSKTYRLKNGEYRCFRCLTKLRRSGLFTRPRVKRVFLVCMDCGKRKRVREYEANHVYSYSYRCRSCYLLAKRDGVIGKPCMHIVLITCEDCGKDRWYRRSQLKKMRFGGKVCAECMYGRREKRESIRNYPPHWGEPLRKIVRERDGFVCQVCGDNDDKIGRQLSVHHIDYVPENTSLDNLVALCCSCHSKTNRSADKKQWLMYFEWWKHHPLSGEYYGIN